MLAYFYLRSLNIIVFILTVMMLNGCATSSKNWQLQKQQDALQYYERQGSQPSLPEFKAAITVQAPLSEVMMLLTDFNRHPEWVYGCEQSTVIALESYTEAYLYQVTALPVIKDRDMLMHATTSNLGDGRMRIRLQAVPEFCDDNNSDDCAAIKASTYVRVTEAQGEFLLTQSGDNSTRIEWTQFVDPAGLLPHWIYRMALPRVPMQSLQQLKVLLENPRD